MSSEVLVFPPREDVGSVSGTEGSSGRALLSYIWVEGPGPAEKKWNHVAYTRIAKNTFVGSFVSPQLMGNRGFVFPDKDVNN